MRCLDFLALVLLGLHSTECYTLGGRVIAAPAARRHTSPLAQEQSPRSKAELADEVRAGNPDAKWGDANKPVRADLRRTTEKTRSSKVLDEAKNEEEQAGARGATIHAAQAGPAPDRPMTRGDPTKRI